MPHDLGLDLTTRGSTGLTHYGGRIDEEWHLKLRSYTQRVRIFQEMRDNDAVIGSILYAIEALIRGIDWTVKPAREGDEVALTEARFLESNITDMSHTWADFISEILSMLPFGWSYFETVYKIRAGGEQDDGAFRSRFSDGRIGWRKHSIRSQETLDQWEFDANSGIRGMWQTTTAPTFSRVFIPIEKSLLFRTKVHKGNPEGRSLMRNAFRAWFFKKRLEETEAVGIERDMAGLFTIEVPPEIMHPGASSAQKALRSKLETLAQQVHRNERDGLVVPGEFNPDGTRTGYRVSLLSAGGRGRSDPDKAIRRYESRIAMSVLAEFILLGMDQHGSFALADSKTSLFAVSLRSILESIAGVLNCYAIPRLMRLNGVPEELWPTLEHGDIESPDLEGLASYISSLVGSAVLTPDKGLERRLRSLARLPELEDGAEPALPMARPAPETVLTLTADQIRPSGSVE